jgi:hypothetical protein
VSGYVRDPALLLEPGAIVHFLEKPYTSLGLARKIREAIEAGGARRGGRAQPAAPAAPATPRSASRS